MKYVVKSSNLAWFNNWAHQFLGDYLITMDAEGWHISQNGKAKVCLVFANLGDMVVEVPPDKTLEVGIDSEKLSNFLKDVGECVLTVSQVDNKLLFETEDIMRKLSTIDRSNLTKARTPKLDNYIKAKFEIELSKLKKAIRLAKRIKDYAFLKVEDSFFKMGAKEEMTGDEVLLKKKLEGEHENCTSIFSMQYLEEGVKRMSSEKVGIAMGEACPIIIRDKPTEKSAVDFYVAPRIVED